ncbi:MAG TPA: nucleotidyltransferase family protein [Gemmatimonadaceae bacterium]|nr:nucleotidyltransferase family protein [Gemmatimonadaceae bacterium]
MPRLAFPSEELRLLFAASRLEMTAEDRREALGAIERGVDWSQVVQLAEQHRCLPLLHKHAAAGDIPIDAVPFPVRGRLDRRANAIAVRNLRLTAELGTIVRELEAHGIPVLPLKGPVVAQTVYGSLALRPIGDLDILCSREDLANAIARLSALGYEPTNPQLNKRVEKMHTSHHVALFSSATRVLVELHFRMYSPFFGAPVELPSVAPRLHRMSLAGTEMSALCPEDLLVHLCIHGSGHAWERLEWLCAVAELVRSGNIRDWARVADWADELRARRLVALGLWLSASVLGAPAPPHSIRPDRRTLAMARRIEARIANDPRRHESALELARIALHTDASIGARFRSVWHACVVPKKNDFVALPLPDVLWPMYYAIRPVRLVARLLGMPPASATATGHAVGGLEPRVNASGRPLNNRLKS